MDCRQPCALVTMASVEETIKTHSSVSFVTIKREGEKDWKCHVFLRGVEAHFESLLTRWDKKKVVGFDPTKHTAKRPSADDLKIPTASHFVKKFRGFGTDGFSNRRRTTRGGHRFHTSRGSYKGRGERAGSYGYSYGGPPSVDSRYHRDSRTRDQHEIDLQERILRQQEMLEMAAKLREQEHSTGRGYYRGNSSYGRWASNTSPYVRSNYNSYYRYRSGH